MYGTSSPDTACASAGQAKNATCSTEFAVVKPETNLSYWTMAFETVHLTVKQCFSGSRGGEEGGGFAIKTFLASLIRPIELWENIPEPLEPPRSGWVDSDFSSNWFSWPRRTRPRSVPSRSVVQGPLRKEWWGSCDTS